MHGFAQLVLTLTLCVGLGAVVGAFMSDQWGKWPIVGAVVGAVAGAWFGLVAAGEMKGGKLLDAIYPPGDDRDKREGRDLDQSARE